MYAKILNNKGIIYYSPVLAIKYCGWNSWAIVFDEELRELVLVYYWNKGKQSILIINNDLTGYKINEVNFKSIWNTKKLSNIKRCIKKDLRYLEEAKQFIKSNNYKEYFEINSIDDLENLKETALSFHDARLIHTFNYNDYIELLFDTSWGSYIKIKALGNIENDVENTIIRDCKIEINNNKKTILFYKMFADENESVEMKLSAENMSFKAYFEIMNTFISLDNFSIDSGKVSLFSKNKNLILPLNKNVVYYLKHEASVNLLFEDDDKINNIEITYGTLIISDLMQKLKIYDCTIIDGDIFDGEFGTEMGTILYKSSKKKFPLMFMIPSLWWPIVWLIVKVFNTSMKWPIFIIIGLTPVFILFVIIFIIFLAKKDDNAFITVCDEGIVLSGIYKYRAISYKKITKIDYDRRIVIFTDKKITLPNTKDKLELYNKICYYYKIYNDNK